ncbi:MAG: hypothetical protein HY912_20300 [Desulfomonile tiedjei]|uniref:Uncharacterized protein n=1 Tax=Desulfomonile tiedjei TaxID=2358 RepID=A0A9D6V4C3_9BACT|nr:hypothetical protein [Desulfomonile tiedjei]
MNHKSKGNLVDFIEEVSKPDSVLRKEFLDELYREGVTAEDLLKLFHRLSYDGVSLEDCGKLVSFASRGSFPCEFDKKY